jgi:hypothetical protein
VRRLLTFASERWDALLAPGSNSLCTPIRGLVLLEVLLRAADADADAHSFSRRFSPYLSSSTPSQLQHTMEFKTGAWPPWLQQLNKAMQT